jgi:hypothetical protein
MRKVSNPPTSRIGPRRLPHNPLFQPSVSHLEKLTSLTEISELELWVLDTMEAPAIKRLKAKAIEILRKSNPRTVCECADAMDVDREPSVVKHEPETDVKLERDTLPPLGGCTCQPPKRVFRLKHLVRKHGQWGTPFWGSDRVEEIEVPPIDPVGLPCPPSSLSLSGL